MYIEVHGITVQKSFSHVNNQSTLYLNGCPLRWMQTVAMYIRGYVNVHTQTQVCAQI